MNILKKVLQRKYCKNCNYKEFHTESQTVKDNLNNQQKEIEKRIELETYFLENTNSFLKSNESIIYFNPSSDSPAILITVAVTYDFKGRIKEIDFYAYPHSFLYKKDLSTISKRNVNQIWIEAVYDEQYDYIKSFHIIDFPCESNSGCGSLIMETALDYLKNIESNCNNNLYIFGELCKRDKQDPIHNARLHYFYGEKFEFDIYFGKNGNEYIKKKL